MALSHRRCRRGAQAGRPGVPGRRRGRGVVAGVAARGRRAGDRRAPGAGRGEARSAPDAVERPDPGARVRREVVPAAAGRVRLRQLRRSAAVPVGDEHPGGPGPGSTDPGARGGRRRPVRRFCPAPRAGTRCGVSGSGTVLAGMGRRPDHPRDRGGPAGWLRRGRSRRDPDPGQRFGFLRLPGAVTGWHPAGLDLLGSPPDAVGRHRTAGRGARRRRAGQRQAPAAADHGLRYRVGPGPGLAGRPQPVRDIRPFRLVESVCR